MRWLFFLCALLVMSGAAAQKLTVKGTVRDTNGAPVPFATITEAGTRNAVTADVNGNFSIQVASNSRLTITSSGYSAVTVPAAPTVNVLLTRNKSEALGEVVVTALGMRRKAEVSVPLQGRVSGLTVSDDAGEGDEKLRTWKRSGLDENSVKLAVGEKDFLPLKSVQVAVQVEGFRARVLFDFFFYNDREPSLSGSFKLKLPAGASPCYFAFGGATYFDHDKGGQRAPLIDYSFSHPLDLSKDSIRPPRRALREARVAPKEKAAYAFNEVVRGNVDPALAQWAGADVFSCSVFPLRPRALHHVVIGYDVNLLQSGGNALLELQLPYPGLRKRVDVGIATAAGIRAALEPELSHSTSGSHARYHAEAFAGESLTIALQLPHTVALQGDGPEPYFAIGQQPELPRTLLPGNTRVVFLLDVSWSSQPDKFNIWLKTLESILRENRRTIREFAVLCFHVDAFWWRPRFSANNERSLQNFLSYAGKLGLVGATDIGGALSEAARPGWLGGGNEAPRTLFLLSDGDASWGEKNLHQLSGRLRPQDRVYAFTTGFSGTDTRVLDHLSRESGGAVFSILNEEEVTLAARAIRYEPWRISGLRAAGGRDLLIAGRPCNLFPGQKIVLSGRGRLPAGTPVEIQLEQGGRRMALRLTADAWVQSGLAKRLYGQMAVQHLETFSYETEMPTAHYAGYFEVPGANNSFIMLENEQLYERFGIDTARAGRFVDSTEVSALIAQVLRREDSSRSLGSARADLAAWVARLRRGGPLKLTADAAFDKLLISLPEEAFRVTVPALHVRNVRRTAWSDETVEELERSSLDYRQLLKRVRREKERSGTADAFTLVSTVAESNREDLTLLRDVAFLLEQWQLAGQSYQLLAELLRSRPAEPATWSMLCVALRKLGKTELALLYYDLAFHTDWDRRFDGFQLILAVEYYKLLKETQRSAKGTVAEFVNQRIVDVGVLLAESGVDSPEADLMVVITWNTDNTDVDLHLREPSGEECYYRHPKTASGGFLSNDATEGFGPEMYFIRNAPKGKYHIDIDYYRESQVRTSAPSKILVQAYKNWGRPNEEQFQKVIELSSDKHGKQAEEDEEKMQQDVLVIDF
ncbi:MAG: VWA domain-containing protein [Chitinophagaceae bacterium]|nr:MAG: VWA domain-containing protein [Chitinophagaceae bacterium]